LSLIEREKSGRAAFEGNSDMQQIDRALAMVPRMGFA
jgi:hypothetical protein